MLRGGISIVKKQNMKIKAFIITFNEADIIRFTIKHYQQFCSEIYIYDNYSTDDTVNICVEMGCVVQSFGTKGVLDDRAYLEVKNNCWKKHIEADYVIVCDADEIIYDSYGAPINKESEFLKNLHLIQCKGYNIYSEELPKKSWDECASGYEDANYNKVLMFDPALVQEINYGFGCHGAKPKLNNAASAIISKFDYRLHHMRYIGGADRMIQRYALYQDRMCEFNIINKLGYQYFSSEEELRHDWEQIKLKSKSL